MLMVEFAIDPLDKGPSIGELVARSVDIIDRSGLKYELNPMGTCIEGEWDQVMNVVRQCVDAIHKDSDRILFTIRGDLRAGVESRIQHQVERVEDVLHRPVEH